jgi:hypothetical protein
VKPQTLFQGELISCRCNCPILIFISFFLLVASTFDFSDLGAITGGDIDNIMDRPNTSSADDLQLFHGRDRAFSFEVFNFSGDELLPAPVESSSTFPASALDTVDEHFGPRSRPRGDSIIFDPASFQDGGIHEKNALEKAASAVPSHTEAQNQMPAPAPVPSSSKARGRPRPAQSGGRGRPSVANNGRNNHLAQPLMNQSSNNNALPAVPGTAAAAAAAANASGETATLPSSLCDGSNNPQSPATFQMDLLNKGGRIGIYLPDARRARIARFHAKRKMRIWRKRIKYDCRKKLADSRPRIKGRFVKRSDMDEDIELG